MTSAERQAAFSSSVPQSIHINNPVTSRCSGRRFFDPREAADYLGINSRTVTRWAREGYLPAYPIGEGKRRLWRFLEGDLEEWVRSRQTGCSDADVSTVGRTLDASHRCSDQRRK